MRNPLVSIIIPVFNAEKYLEQGLKSLQQQTLKEIEIIMVNDGSTDSSETICRAYSERDERFILINQENGGSAAARRTGMMAAKGEYIGFIDADDWCEPKMFETLYDAGKLKNADIVFCNCYRDYPDRVEKCKPYLRNGYYNRDQIKADILSWSLASIDEKGGNRVLRWANYLRIYKRELIENHSIYNDPTFRRCQDLQITFEATLYAQSYYYLGDEYLYHNRVVENSQSRGYTVNFWEKLRGLILKLYEDVENFTEINLKEQMDLCAFFFATQACSNERKHPSDASRETVAEILSTICRDTICTNAIHTVPYDRLSKVNKIYYDAFKKKDVNLVFKALEQEEKTEKIGAIKSALLGNKVVNLLNMYRHKIKEGTNCEK